MESSRLILKPNAHVSFPEGSLIGIWCLWHYKCLSSRAVKMQNGTCHRKQKHYLTSMSRVKMKDFQYGQEIFPQWRNETARCSLFLIQASSRTQSSDFTSISDLLGILLSSSFAVLFSFVLIAVYLHSVVSENALRKPAVMAKARRIWCSLFWSCVVSSAFDKNPHSTKTAGAVDLFIR